MEVFCTLPSSLNSGQNFMKLFVVVKLGPLAHFEQRNGMFWPRMAELQSVQVGEKIIPLARGPNTPKIRGFSKLYAL